jgi:hypothetical protein
MKNVIRKSCYSLLLLLAIFSSVPVFAGPITNAMAAVSVIATSVVSAVQVNENQEKTQKDKAWCGMQCASNDDCMGTYCPKCDIGNTFTCIQNAKATITAQKSETCQWSNNCPTPGGSYPTCCDKPNGNAVLLGATCNPWIGGCGTTVKYCTQNPITSITPVTTNGCNGGSGTGTSVFTATCGSSTYHTFEGVWSVECNGPCNGSPC